MFSSFRNMMLATIAAVLLAPLLANATAITTSSDLIVSWSIPTGVRQITGEEIIAAARLELFNFAFNGDKVTFQMDATNTSTGTSNGLFDSRLTAFGWDTTPAAGSAVVPQSPIYQAAANESLPPVGQLSVCFFSGFSCDDVTNGGLEDPQNTGLFGDPTTTTFNVTIFFGGAVPPLDFFNFDARFLGSVGDIEVSGTVTNCTSNCSGTTFSAAPEPSTLALLGLGVLGIGAVARRR